jgi:FkbM family methyltransferase
MTFRDSGLKFICIKNDKRLASIETLNFGEYEKNELAMQLCLIQQDDTILDIGANLGWYTMHISKINPSAKVFSFEPIPSIFNYLNQNIELNRLGNIKTFNFGFSDTEGSFDFYFDPLLSVNASLANVSNKNGIESISCSVKKLDNFIVEQNIKVDFIKCDVEGAELLVFRGGIDLLKKDKPIIFTEMLRKYAARFNYHPNDIIIFFQKLGYLCFTSKNCTLIPFEKVDEDTIDTNYFLLHKEKHDHQIKRFVKN